MVPKILRTASGRTREPLMRAIFALCLCFGCSLLCGCSKPLSEKECSTLLDRYVELLVSSDRPGTNAAELHKLQAQARSRVSHDPEFAKCAKQVSRREFECAMQAP